MKMLHRTVRAWLWRSAARRAWRTDRAYAFRPDRNVEGTARDDRRPARDRTRRQDGGSGSGAGVSASRRRSHRPVCRADLDPTKLPLGAISAAGGRRALGNFKYAIERAMRGEGAAVTFSPFNKSAMRLAHPSYQDEGVLRTEMPGIGGRIQHHCQSGERACDLACPNFRRRLFDNVRQRVSGTAIDRADDARERLSSHELLSLALSRMPATTAISGARRLTSSRRQSRPVSAKILSVRHPFRPTPCACAQGQIRRGADNVSRSGSARDRAAWVRARRQAARRPSFSRSDSSARLRLRHRWKRRGKPRRHARGAPARGANGCQTAERESRGLISDAAESTARPLRRPQHSTIGSRHPALSISRRARPDAASAAGCAPVFLGRSPMP